MEMRRSSDSVRLSSTFSILAEPRPIRTQAVALVDW